MKKGFYFLVKYGLRLYNYFYFRRVCVYGLEQVPRSGGVLFSPNHQNAFLDPLLVGSYCPKPVTSLTRGDVFGGRLQWFLDALQMLPVFRIRNGYSSLKNNEATFEKCFDILAKGGSIMMFSEGGHHGEYFLQPLSKGSSRLMCQAQLKHLETPMFIVPVGINYGSHKRPLADVHLVFGTPISVGKYCQSEAQLVKSINTLKNVLADEMRQTLWLPDNDANYQHKKRFIHATNTRLAFDVLKKKLEKGSDLAQPKAIPRWTKPFLFITNLVHFPPLFALRKVLSLFEDDVFHASLKYILGGVFFPLWCAVLAGVVWVYVSLKAAILLLIVCTLMLYGRQKLLLKQKT